MSSLLATRRTFLAGMGLAAGSAVAVEPFAALPDHLRRLRELIG
jgi:hypothetical protein